MSGLCAALERTYLSWMHMAVTLGGVMTALVGFTYNSEEPSSAAARCEIPSLGSYMLCRVVNGSWFSRSDAFDWAFNTRRPQSSLTEAHRKS